MKYQISWDLKSDRNALGLMEKRGGDLVKAMKAVGDSRRQGNQSDAVKRGIQQSHDQFAKDMIDSQLKLEQINQSEKNIQDGIKLLKNVKAMLTSSNGIQKQIRTSQALWASMTKTGRELQNADLKKILSIRQSISIIFNACVQLRHNGSSVFGKTVNIQQTTLGSSQGIGTGNGRQGDTGAPYTSQGLQGVMYQGNGRGHVIDFGTFYSDLRQNLIYIRENISSYTEKSSITQRFNNCDAIVSKAIRYCDDTTQLFSQVNGGLRYSKRTETSKRDALINQRQNELTKEAVVGILNGSQNGVALGGTADQGTGRI